LVLLLLALVLVTLWDYGITWDEPLHDEYGDLVVDYYTSRLSGEPDNQALDFHNLYLYGGAFDSLVSVARRLSPIPRFETRHLITALVGLFGLVGCWRLTRLVSGPGAAFWALALLAITPRYYGHMFNNPKDIPFAVGYVWAVYFLLKASRQLPEVKLATAAGLALCIGFAMGVRVGGLILLLYWGAILVAYSLYLLSVEYRRRALRSEIVPITLSFFKVAVPAYLIMLAAWPWAHQLPIKRPIEALGRISKFRWNRPVLFDGMELKARELPTSYYPDYFSIVLPELMLVLLPVAVIVSLVMVARYRNALNSQSVVELSIVTFAAVHPLIHIAVLKAVVYDGIRHLLFVLPLFACISGTTLVWLIGAIGSRSRRLQTLMILTV
jgi:hypothetical protein